jgi:hypothetical protein
MVASDRGLPRLPVAAKLRPRSEGHERTQTPCGKSGKRLLAGVGLVRVAVEPRAGASAVRWSARSWPC